LKIPCFTTTICSKLGTVFFKKPAYLLSLKRIFSQKQFGKIYTSINFFKNIHIMKSKTNKKIELKKRTIATAIMVKLVAGQCVIGDDTEPIHIDRPTDGEICNH
jgi:hypothetical protein